MKLTFLLGMPKYAETQNSLENEAAKFDDILQIDVEDSYHTLSYKSLSGFIWVKKISTIDTKYILKIDDDVEMYWETLIDLLLTKYPDGIDDNIIECPSVMRNMPPWRPRRSNHKSSIMSKW